MSRADELVAVESMNELRERSPSGRFTLIVVWAAIAIALFGFWRVVIGAAVTAARHPSSVESQMAEQRLEAGDLAEYTAAVVVVRPSPSPIPQLTSYLPEGASQE